MADRNINLKITTETPGSERIAALTKELDRLASEGGKAGPKFAQLSAELKAMQPAGGAATGVLGRVREAVAGLGSAGSSLMGILGRLAGFLGIGGAGIAGGVLAIAKSAADAADSMAKLSQRTGVSTESLSRLSYAASLNDATTNDLEMGFKSLAERMQEAANGGDESAGMFQRLGLSVQNADGSMRGVDEVFLDLAERFEGMPDGAEKTATAVDLLSRSGLALIPTLNSGRQGLKDLGDEADRFGKTITAEAAAKAAAFNDNITRLQALSQGLAIEIGNKLIPALNALAEDFLNASSAGLSFGEAIVGIGLNGSTESAAEQVANLTAKLKELRQEREKQLGFVGGREGVNSTVDGIDREIATSQKLLNFYTARANAEAKAAEKQAEERKNIEQGLLAETIRLEKLRAVAAGTANADILKDDRTLQAERVKEAQNATNEQIKGTERLREALKTAWQTSIEAARQAKKEAEQFFIQADQAGKSRNSQAQERLDRSLSEPEREAKNTSKASELVSQAITQSVYAENAVIDKRSEAAQKGALKALELAKEAAEYVNKVGDDSTAANLLIRLGEAEKSALTTQGKLREQEAKNQEDVAKAIVEQITAAEERLAGLKAALEAPVSIQLDITAAEAKIQTLQRKLAELNGSGGGGDGGVSSLTQGDLRKFDNGSGVPVEQQKVEVSADTGDAQESLQQVQRAVDTIPEKKQIRIETVTSGSSFSDAASAWNSGLNGYASGGPIRGPGTGTSDSILARLSNGEYVVRAEAVRRYGIDALNRLNHLQMPRFADGGLVGSSAAASSLMSTASDKPQLAPVNLHFPGQQAYPMLARQDVAKEINDYFRRAALRAGGRR